MNDLILPKKELEKQEWFQALIEDLRAIIVERTFESNLVRLKMKWEIGDRILRDYENFQRFGYGEKVVETLAEYLNISASHLWKIIQFRKMFPTWKDVEEKLPLGKNISWYQVCQKVLPKTDNEKKLEQEKKELQEKCPHELLKCKMCGKEFTLTELLQQFKDEM